MNVPGLMRKNLGGGSAGHKFANHILYQYIWTLCEMNLVLLIGKIKTFYLLPSLFTTTGMSISLSCKTKLRNLALGLYFSPQILRQF